jgi:tetratricopeptide (TPR) repeat protein
VTEIRFGLDVRESRKFLSAAAGLASVVLILLGCASEPEYVPYQSQRAKVLNELGLTNYRKGDVKSALVNFYNALEHAEAVDNRESAVFAHISIGQIMIDQARLEEAQVHVDRAVKIAADLDDETMLCNAQKTMGGLLFEAGDYEGAESHLLEALDIAKDLELGEKEGLILNDLGAVYKEQGRIEEALERLHHALFIFDNLEGRIAIEGRGSVSNNLAEIRTDQGKYAEAWDLYTTSLANYQNLEDADALVTCHTNMAHLLEKWGKNSDALLRYERAFGVAKEIPNRVWMEICLTNILRLSRALGRMDLYEKYKKLSDALRSEIYGQPNPP